MTDQPEERLDRDVSGPEDDEDQDAEPTMTAPDPARPDTGDDADEDRGQNV